MYNSDNPICSKSEDLLGRTHFSERLGKEILSYTGKDSIVVGLYGKWGSGKTSVIKMMIETIDRMATDGPNKPLIIWFLPWNYSSQEDLICQFFMVLMNSINKDVHLKETIGKTLNEYADAFGAASIIPIMGPIVAPVLKASARKVAKSLSKSNDLMALKRDLEEKMCDINQKIIVIIDDIDRLSKTQIRETFQLVKQTANLPNIIYVLSMDRNVVVKALDDVQGMDGVAYLEKIVQIPFEIPEVNNAKLQNVFFSRLNEVIISGLDESNEINKQYWGRVFDLCIKPYLKTIRDVNRIINVFQFKYGLFCDEICLEDIAALTAIEVMNPNLYRWISEHDEYVCGSLSRSIETYNKSKEDVKKEYLSLLEESGVSEVTVALDSLSILFPYVARVVNNTVGSIRDGDGRNRISETERFKLYFGVEMDAISVPRKTIIDSLTKYDKEMLDEMLERINTPDKMPYYLQEVLSLTDRIPDSRIRMITEWFFEKRLLFKGNDSTSFFFEESPIFAMSIIQSLLLRFDKEEEITSFLLGVLESDNPYSIESAANCINKMGLAYNRWGDGGHGIEWRIVSEEHLDKLERAYSSSIQTLSQRINLLKCDEFSVVFYLWAQLDKTNADRYLNEKLKDEINCLNYLCRMSGRWNGTNGSGWQCNIKADEHITEERLYDIIVKYDKKELFNQFSDDDMRKIASFSLLYENANSFHNVTDEMAEKLIKEWEKA